MNTLVIVLIAVVVLGAGYVFYGRHLAKKWGFEPKADTPAVNIMTVRIMFRQTVGPYFLTNFHQLRVQAL